MTDSTLFLRTRARSCREAAAGVNPCADTDDSAKSVLLDHAKQYDAAADEIVRERRLSAITVCVMLVIVVLSIIVLAGVRGG